MKLTPLLTTASALTLLVCVTAACADDQAPRAHDPRLTVERFAAAPDIVHPVGLDFDARGRLLVIESHTHFRPPNYKGPKHDRIRAIEDTDGDGPADRLRVLTPPDQTVFAPLIRGDSLNHPSPRKGGERGRTSRRQKTKTVVQ